MTWGTGTPKDQTKDRDEVIFRLIQNTTSLTRMFPTFDVSMRRTPDDGNGTGWILNLFIIRGKVRVKENTYNWVSV